MEIQVPGTIGAISQNLQAKVGQRWLEVLRKHLDRAGLMLWATASGSFVLSAPNAAQTPSYQLYRFDGQTNITNFSMDDSATSRHSEAIIYGKGGGRKSGRKKAKGIYVDQEMVDYGYSQPLVIRDEYVQTGAQAAYLARRRLAEERRDGWHLEYTIAGHTLPAFNSPNKRAVLTVDTVVAIQDNITGVYGNYYIEGVTRRRGPETTTTIRLMRPADMVFGDISSPKTQGAVKPKAASSNKRTYYYFAQGVPYARQTPPVQIGQNNDGSPIYAVPVAGTP
jgi:prophage tail gpP-like protein